MSRPIDSRAALLLGLVAASTAGCPITQQTLYGGPPVDQMDFDGDGSFAGDDCNDQDASVHPGAADTTADGVDQNCDGVDGPTPEEGPP
jgi:hypothetical protein